MGDDPLRAACLVAGIELEEPIASGRHATVWRARWRERDVAVKLLAEGGRSGRPARRLSHPSILDVLEAGEALGRRYVVLERFPTDLRRLLGGRPLRRELLRPVLLPLVDALDHAHRRGVVHGDLKPANVLVDPAARPLRVALCDFGAGPEPDAGEQLDASITSRERDEWQSTATVAYLAPERLAGAAPSPAADVYALGVLLFEVLTGRLPSALERPSEVARGLDRRWDAMVKAALSRDSGARPRLEALRRDLLRLLPRGDELAPEPEPLPPAEAAQVTAGSDGLVRIPEGFLVVGDKEDPDARPMHEVKLKAFRIARTPVTNREFAEFVTATGAARPRAWPARGRVPARLLDLPVTGIPWSAADAYARWRGLRLPSELEWERAAQGPEQRRYPYGDALDLSRIHEGLAPVGTRPEGASSEGVHDLTGNGWEWTASPFVPYESTRRGPGPAGRGPGPAASPAPAHPRTIRGGWDPRRPRSGSATFRAGLRPDVADPLVGFRCAADA